MSTPGVTRSVTPKPESVTRKPKSVIAMSQFRVTLELLGASVTAFSPVPLAVAVGAQDDALGDLGECFGARPTVLADVAQRPFFLSRIEMVKIERRRVSLAAIDACVCGFVLLDELPNVDLAAPPRHPDSFAITVVPGAPIAADFVGVSLAPGRTPHGSVVAQAFYSGLGFDGVSDET